MRIFAAGYIIADNGVIHGAGATQDAARADFRRTMDAARITLLADDAKPPDDVSSWTRESRFRTLPATAALLTRVALRGGTVTWFVTDGIACTPEEADDYGDAYKTAKEP